MRAASALANPSRRDPPSRVAAVAGESAAGHGDPCPAPNQTARLTDQQPTVAPLKGLRVLRENADAQAVALALPLLRDTNSIVRHRAFDLLHAVSGQDIPQDKPAKWDQWWATNKATFNATKPPR